MMANLTLSIVCLLLIACNNKKAGLASTTPDQGRQSEISLNSKIPQPPVDDIVGYWKLMLEAYDENSNKTLDENERKKGFKNRYTYRFNADGSCRIQDIYKGRYQLKKESSHEMLYVYRNRVAAEEDKDPVPDVYRIISRSKNEIVLLEQLGNLTFWVFQRAN